MRFQGSGWRRLRALLAGRGRTPSDPGDWPAPVPAIRWFKNQEDYRRYVDPGRADRRVRELEVGRKRTWRGLCTYCRAPQDFVVSTGVWLGDNVNLREGLVCPACGLKNRLRLIFKAVEEFGGSPAELRKKRTYVAERVTTFYQRLADRIDDVVGSEYLGARCVSGQSQRVGLHRVRHEDLCRLSFPDESFDLVIHADVLEHVPDFRRAFAELHRVTRRGGGMFFSLPFRHDLAEDEVRASSQADGSIVHHLPAVYHGTPAHRKGALAYRTYGWSLLDTLRGVGFARAEAGVLADLDLGLRPATARPRTSWSLASSARCARPRPGRALLVRRFEMPPAYLP